MINRRSRPLIPALCPSRREGATLMHRSADMQRAGIRGRGFRFLFCEKKRLNFCSRKRRLLPQSMLLANKKIGKRAKIMWFRILRKRSIFFARNLNLPDTFSKFPWLLGSFACDGEKPLFFLKPMAGQILKKKWFFALESVNIYIKF